ncbi:MAG: histidine ammonia-lyase [Alicyclobacillus sp.]|nr:histidine ammonia-lyase [Alicyclobacillus sp.]
MEGRTVVYVDGFHLTREGFHQVVFEGAPVALTAAARERVARCRDRIEQIVDAGTTVYGVTTGFGKLSDVSIPPADSTQLQQNLVRSHAVGVGPAFPQEVVRGMLLLRANALARGNSGITLQTLDLLLQMLNRGVHPVVPEQGSLGASGDLAPLAHIALVLIGEGRAMWQGEERDGGSALRAAGLEPVQLTAKEGLALINGTQAMTAVGAIALREAEHLGLWADAAAALTMEALRGVTSAFDPDLLATRPHPEQEEVAARVRAWLAGSRRVCAQGELRVQDAYSLRCVPQVHGASWQAWKYGLTRVETEMNATTDNPVVLDDGRVLSGGQFHGQPLAIAMDLLKIGAAEWASISERRVERLVNPQLSGLAAFLAHRPGLESGLMIAQYVAAALVSENKVLAHPASVDSIPSSANQEDHVSMGTIAARQARQIVHNALRVVAIELLCASQAIYLQRAEADCSERTRHLLEWVRAVAPPLQQDASTSGAIERLADAMAQQVLWP